MKQTTANPLYPVFFKLHELHLLIVGAGEVGFEKLSFILKSSPQARVTIVAPEVSDKILALLEGGNFTVNIEQRPFVESDIEAHDLIIAATNIPELNVAVRTTAKKYRRLINVADSPSLCDFYLGSVVTKGHLKIAISTNGQSPTLAKRMRQLLEEVLPEDIDDLIQNLKVIRDDLAGDFASKVERLNELTASLIGENGEWKMENSRM